MADLIGSSIEELGSFIRDASQHKHKRKAGHTVRAPDLYGGRTFATLDEGVAYAEQVGFGEIIERGVRAASGLRNELRARRAVPPPGAQHLFADLSLPSYDAGVAALLTRRVLDFLRAR